MSNKEIKEYDKNNNLIYHKYSSGYEYWYKYDDNNNKIHYKNNDGSEYWMEYDENNNLIHYKDFSGYERWYKYDKNNKRIKITQQEFKQIERRKTYLNNKKINRFEIMDI